LDSHPHPAQGSPPGTRRTSTANSAVYSVRRDKQRAKNVITFIQKLTVPTGEGQGKPFKLRRWQKRFIRDVYEPIDQGTKRRIVRRAILSIGRKNGKSALIACLALVHLVGPERVRNGEIYSAANDRDQAAIIFKVAQQIVEADPELMAAIDLVPSKKTMVGRRMGSVYRAISAEAGTKLGYNPTFVIYDELSQSKSRTLYDVLDTAMGARAEPLFITISTQSNDPEHILSKLIDDGLHANDPRIVCHLYAVPEDCENIFDPSVWKLGNPALGDFLNQEDMQADADKAQRLPAEEPRFRNLRLNQRVSPTASLISRVEWEACAGHVEFEDGEDVYLALDMSTVIDLTALMIGSAGEQTRVQPVFWKPEDMLREQGDHDFGTGSGRYEQWHDQHFLEVSPGRAIDPEVVARKIAELHDRYRIRGLAYDRWRIADLLREFDRIGLACYEDNEKKKGSGVRIVPWGQGYRDMAPAIDALELEIKQRTLIHNSNPVLTWNMANAVATMDPAGNRKIDKEKARFRIDGAVALAMLCGLKSRDRNVPARSYQMIFL
jgi:phage terminase large subunit-like protein